MRARLPRTTRRTTGRTASMLLTLALATPGLGALAVTTAPPAAALGNGTALTPPMGWNSWNSLSTSVNEQEVQQTIDYMSANGLVAAGYNTVTIDDGWSLRHRTGQSTDLVENSYGALQLYDGNGNPVLGTDGTGNDPTSGHLVPDPQNFPSQVVNGQTLNGIQYLAWYAHSKGMKFGLYATDTYTTCQGHPGSLGHESTDASDFVSWGVDYVKYDDCPYGPQIIGPDGHNYWTQGEGKELTESMYARVQTFQQDLDSASAAQGRPKVTLSVSAQPVHSGVPYLLNANDPARTDPVIQAAGTPQYDSPGDAPTAVWCGQVANLCRIGGDRDSELSGVLYNGALQTALQYPNNVRPGSWNDMDMLFTGWNDPYGVYGVTDSNIGSRSFTDDESRTEMSILSMMAAPLISGADLRTAAQSQHSYNGVNWSTGINANSLAILKNPGMIAIDQDSLAKPATLVGSAPNSPTAPVVLKRQLANGSTAVLLVNQDPTYSQSISTTLGALGLTGPGYSSKEVWTGAGGNVTGTGALGTTLAPHASALYVLTPLPTTIPAAVVGDGRYHAISAGGTGGQVLEVAGTCSANVGGNADINTWSSTHTSEQWTFTTNPDGTTQISDNCATGTQNHTVLAAGTSAGGSAYLLNYSPGNPWQEWRVLQNTATGALSITNVGTGLALDTSGTAAGATVVTNAPNGNAPGQSWSLTS
ncbi:alpha-galactosidase [Kitasatospora sp. NBC_01287]|uniref:alpha-galactosidase n=1 Tax=Kitasatospora sp. NBC_01287 TaxID=2903573 RepID=UPI00225B8055|nr:alpha-galactosidase [Kitasatospora sp. NBC_01287]MCX4745749.1 alpha-galactosidase [Kitasatospora sp. NBC_01287]